MKEREAFQELDYKAVFGSIAKWVVVIDDAARIPELVSRAFHVAMQGRPGPVVIALPEDMLVERACVADARRAGPAAISAGPDEMAMFGKMLAQARAPMLLLGGSGWTGRGRRAHRGLRRPVRSARRRDLQTTDAVFWLASKLCR